MIFEPETTESETENRETPWPGGQRAIDLPAEPLPESVAYFDGSDLAEIDPNLTGLWPNEKVDDDAPTEPFVPIAATVPAPTPDVSTAFESPLAPDDPQLPPRAWQPEETGPALKFVPENYIPETPDESIRRSGLAWSAGIVFFGSVAFMLFLGWGADLLFGSSPFGMVAGIVIGSMIGFIQFFRVSKQIYAPSSRKSDIRPLLSRHDDDLDPK
ncbi:MAG: AtpZ/AtpI family protein [Pyrinomonadaceae bacterium]